MKENVVCSECGVVLTEGNVHEFDSHIMCEECFERLTTNCDNCSTRIWRDNAEGDSNYILCHHCYEYSYTTCEDCGRLIHNEDAFYEDDSDYPYCGECFEKLNNNSIKNYNYKPEPIFYGSGDIFYGVELEIDRGGECNQNAEKLYEIANRNDDRIYCKHDGSLSDGFEIVSYPMTLNYHINNMNWLDIFEKAIEMGYRSHNTHTCGLHIHVNRSAFGEDYNIQERAITEMIESKGDSLTQRQHEYIEMLDRVYDLKTINKTESFFGGIVRTMGFVASTFKNQKSVSYVPDLPIIKMCMEFVYIRNNKHEYDEFSEVFDELPVSRKDFKNICHEIEKEAVNGIEHIISKYEIAKIKADEKEGIFWIDVPEIHIPAFKMTVDVSYGSEWEEEWNEIEEAIETIVGYFEMNKTTLPKGYLREITAEIKNRISAGGEEAEDKYRGD